MRIEKRKSLEKKIFTVMLAGVLVVASMTTTFAKTVNWNIEGLDITGTNKVTSTYGKGTTGGSAEPYSNRVVVTVYNKKGEQKNMGANTKQNAAASKTVLGMKLKRAYSCHGVYDINYSFVDGKLYGINTTR